MGLLCGSATFTKPLGKFELLSIGQYVSMDTSSTVPVLLAMDAMCRLTGLQGRRDVPCSEELNKNGKRGLSCDRPVFPTHEIATAFFRPLLDFVKCHQHTQVTIAIMCDVCADVPLEKAPTQQKRARVGSYQPYAIDVTEQKVQITDQGIVVDGAEPMAIDMAALMSTRALRPYLYQYIRAWIPAHHWTHGFALIFDGEFPHLGHQAFVYEIQPGRRPVESVAEHSGTGEGEISAMIWALRMKDTHRVQLHSGDLDMLALALMHGDKFRYDLAAILCGRYTFSYRSALVDLQTRGFLWQDVILGAILLGTDFVMKKLVTHRAGTWAIFEGVRSMRITSQTTCLLELVNISRLTLGKTLTAANNIAHERKQLGNGSPRGAVVSQTEHCDPTIHRDIVDWLRRRPGGLQPRKVDVTEDGMRQVKFNVRYWTTLGINFSRPLAHGGEGEGEKEKSKEQ